MDAMQDALEDIVLEGGRFRMVIGGDARLRSLVVKENGVECAVGRASVPFFSVTQERPFNNETKLAHPNKRMTFPANRVRRDGDLLRVGFETAKYEALVSVKVADGYVAFKLVGFECDHDAAYGGLLMNVPPVARFRIAQLPAAAKANFGEWLNICWDEESAVAVVGCDPYAEVDNEEIQGGRLLFADLARGMRLVGGCAAVVVGRGEGGFLDSMDELEADFGLPRGVRSRRSGKLDSSAIWTVDLSPENVDWHIDFAKKAGLAMMLVYYPAIVLSEGYALLGNYDLKECYPNGYDDVRKMLAKIKAAGITPGLHVLHPHIGIRSRYVTPTLDPRLNKTRRFTLSRPIGADGAVGEVCVEENPVDAAMSDGCRVLAFGGEAFSYEGYSTEWPYRFFGVRRGHYATNHVAHPRGEVGGTLDVSEYGATSLYIDQRTSLQDEVADKIAKIYDCGFEFCYFDGSEGVHPPYGVNVPLAQSRVTSKLATPPLFTEGAAKAHFGWHSQAGGNAFDAFPPEVFKEKIAEFPMKEAPQMRQDMTRIDFGWWVLYMPGTEVTLGSPQRRVKSVGTQPDMWEFGTSRAAAWNCPVTAMLPPNSADHPRIDDLLETLRRWEDVRRTDWLTPEQREMLKSPTQEHHLYLDENGEYELHEIEMLPQCEADLDLRGFIFERNGRRVVAFWPMTRRDPRKYVETDLGKAEAIEAYRKGTLG